jgi:hypothetical protein
MRKQSVAQSASIRLKEGDPYEREFRVEDWTKFISVGEDAVFEAEELMISGVDGRRPYKVKNSNLTVSTKYDTW